MRELWENAGLDDVTTRRIDISLTYDDFDDFWDANTGVTNTVSKAMATLSPNKIEELRTGLRATLPVDSDGRIFYGAHANAVKGNVK